MGSVSSAKSAPRTSSSSIARKEEQRDPEEGRKERARGRDGELLSAETFIRTYVRMCMDQQQQQQRQQQQWARMARLAGLAGNGLKIAICVCAQQGHNYILPAYCKHKLKLMIVHVIASLYLLHLNI